MPRWGGGIVAMGLLAAVEARAQPGPPVRLELQGCAAIGPTATRRILEVELGTQLVTWDGAGVTAITIQCRGPVAFIQVDDPVTRKVVSRGVNLADVAASARARLVALATAELVIASWAELEVPGPPTVEPEGTPAPPETVAAAQEMVRAEMEEREEAPPLERRTTRSERRLGENPTHHRVFPVGSGRGFLNQPGGLWGGGIRIGQERAFAFSWTLDGLVERGVIRSNAGRFAVTSTTVGGHVTYSFPSPQATFRCGAGLRLGVVSTEFLEGFPELRSTSMAAWGWPMLTMSTTLSFTKHLALEVAGEGGYVLLPVGTSRAGGVAMEGPWLGGQAGLGYLW